MTYADLKGLAVAGKIAQNAEALKKIDADNLPAGEWMMEPKYDGWRIIAFVGDGTVDLFTRTGNAPNGDLPAIKAELLDKFPAGTILDGEAVALTPQEDGTILNEWSVAQSALTKFGANVAQDKITYMVFDLIAHRGIDARSLPTADRRVLLERIFEEEDGFDAVQLTTIMEATKANYDCLIAATFEGAVCKRIDKPYGSNKREGGGWIKLKASTRVEVVTMGCKPGKNGWTGLVGAVVFGQHDPDTGALVERGACSGFDMRTRLAMSAKDDAGNVILADKWMGRVIEIAHMGVDIGKNGTGRFRSPQFKRDRKDKTPEQVVMHDA